MELQLVACFRSRQHWATSSRVKLSPLMVLQTSSCFKRGLKLGEEEHKNHQIKDGLILRLNDLIHVSEFRLPVHWDKTAIVVMKEVRVSSPYLPECVRGGTPAVCDRVKKVLEFDRKRMQARGTSQ